jgi:uncharacterized protein (TIRG00374 family)
LGKKTLSFLFFFGIGIVLVWLSLRGLSNDDKAQAQISDALHHADYTWIFISIAVGMLSHLSRAMRWRLLLEPMGYTPKLSNAFYAVMVGYLANYAMRLGEVLRPALLQRYEKIPFAEGFGTVIVERIVDMLLFFVLAIVVFFLQFNTLYDYVFNTFLPGLSAKLAGYGSLLYLLAGLFLIGAGALVLLRRRIMRLLNEKMKKLVDGFKEGINAIRKVKRPWLFIFHSIFIWFIYYAMLHICFLCIPETAHVSVGCALTVLLFGTLAVIITPGGLGAYPPAVAGILILYHVEYGTGTAIGWLVWLSQLAAILVFGSLSLLLLPLTNKEHAAQTKPS